MPNSVFLDNLGVLPVTSSGSTAGITGSIAVGTNIGVGGTSLTGAGVNVYGTKTVTGIADNTATAVLTWTATNAQMSALLKIKVVGIMGAGGAIGVGESVTGFEFMVAITRTAGANAVSAAASATETTGAATISGGANITMARSLGAVAGGSTADNTQDIKITIAHAGGSSTNHIALLSWELINYTANGVSVA